MRSPMRITPWILPLFLLMGLTRGRCFAEVTDSQVRVKLGWLFDRRFPLPAIARASLVSIPWYCGPGVHIDLRGRTFVTGAWGQGVEFEFTSAQTTSWLYGRRCTRLVLTPRDASALVAAISGVPA